jgi:signal transduction histidine kinase
MVPWNILANAIDALDEGDRPNGDRLASSITIITKTSAAGVIEITIADNGSGMSDQVRSQVFDHLFTTKPVGQGTGLGLSIAHQIMTQKHQGTLRVKSTLGQGSSFILTLPQSPSTPKASSQQADA